MGDVFAHEKVPEIVSSAVAAAAQVNQPNFARASDLLFLAWRQQFLEEWKVYEERLSPVAVKMARRLADDDADRVVFRQPLAYTKAIGGQQFEVRDLVYTSAPFWFAAYYDIAVEALG